MFLFKNVWRVDANFKLRSVDVCRNGSQLSDMVLLWCLYCSCPKWKSDQMNKSRRSKQALADPIGSLEGKSEVTSLSALNHYRVVDARFQLLVC